MSINSRSGVMVMTVAVQVPASNRRGQSTVLGGKFPRTRFLSSDRHLVKYE